MNLIQSLPHFHVYAQAQPWTGLQGADKDVATFQSLETLFSNLVRAIIGIVGIALFIMFLVGGFSFLFSGGDPKKLEQARGTLTNAVIGLVIIVAAFLIMRIIEVFTGVQVTIFKIPIQ